MLYKIGEVSKILGISPELMRYYEKKGVVSPYKDMNDYRYYEPWDVNHLIECLWLKSFRISIKDISEILSEYSYGELEEALAGRRDEITEELAHKQMVLERLSDQIGRLATAKTFVGQCAIRYSPEIVCFLNRYNLAYDNDAEIQALCRQWLNYFPFSRRHFEIRACDLYEGGTDLAWGFSLEADYANRLSIAARPPVTRLPPEKSVYSVVRQPGKYKFSAASLRHMVDYVRHNKLKICGQVRGHLLCSVRENGQMTGYFEVWIPVEH